MVSKNCEIEYNSIYLQFDMKKALINMSAFVLMIWYCLSVIGFDVHICGATGRVFVSPVMTAECYDSEQSEECRCGCCSHCCDAGSNASGYSDNSCCSDDYQALIITGGASSENHRHFDECSCGLYPCVLMSESDVLKNVCVRTLSYRLPDKGLPSPSDFQAILSVWLI